MNKILELIDSYWKFDEYQYPTSSWHDKQDLIKVVEQYIQQNLPNDEEIEKIGEKYIGGVDHCFPAYDKQEEFNNNITMYCAGARMIKDIINNKYK
jgi:hypothetical protein